MKKIILALLLACFMLFSAQSSEAAPPKIHTSLLSDIYGAPNITVDWGLGDDWSLGVAAFYFDADLLIFDLDIWGIGPRGDYYITGTQGSDAWYVGASIFFVRVSAGSYFFTDTAGYTVGFGFYTGYQWIWDSGFLMRLGTGYAIDAPLLDFRIGYRF